MKIRRRNKLSLTTGEVAKICDVAPRTVSKWCDSGRLKHYRIPTEKDTGSKEGDRRVYKDDLVAFMRLTGMRVPAGLEICSRVLLIGFPPMAVSLLDGIYKSENIIFDSADNGFDAGVYCAKHLPQVIAMRPWSIPADDAICMIQRIMLHDNAPHVLVLLPEDGHRRESYSRLNCELIEYGETVEQIGKRIYAALNPE